MTDSKQIETMLTPHMESLRCVLDFAADRANLALAGKAADALFQSSTGAKEFRQAQQTLTAIALLGLSSFKLVQESGKIDYSAFTAEACAGLWEICYLGNNKATREKFPELARKLRAAEFDYHVELAKVFMKLS
jgi:hypothetical protein